jgi:hypothetical protein
MKPDMQLAQRLVEFLNELTEIDRPAVAALIANRIPCNKTLADHPTVQVAGQHGGFHVGLLGLLNGLCGIHEHGHGAVSAVFETDDAHPDRYKDLQKFKVVTADDDRKWAEVPEPQKPVEEPKPAEPKGDPPPLTGISGRY